VGEKLLMELKLLFETVIKMGLYHIRKGMRLKKTETIDKSVPRI
jgi:hypothetical protein